LERNYSCRAKEPALQKAGIDRLSYYIDTNIFDYSALAHPTYGKACKQIIDDIQNEKIQAYCGFLVPIELLGSLSQIDPEKAVIAVEAFFSLPINMIQIDEQILHEAAAITLETRVSYDSIHAACMQRKGLDAIITEDTNNWRKIGKFKIIRPLEYEKSFKTQK
jgi:predicted nucleic acid-binding protein